MSLLSAKKQLNFKHKFTKTQLQAVIERKSSVALTQHARCSIKNEMFHVFRLTAAAVAVDHTAGKWKTFNKTTTQLLIIQFKKIKGSFRVQYHLSHNC